MTTARWTPPSSDPAAPAGLGRRFNLFWAGESINVLGTSTTVALIPLIAVFTLDAEPQWVGVIAAAAWVPWLLIAIPVGVVVDSYSPRILMIASNVVAISALVTIPLAYIGGQLSLMQLAVVALIVGATTVVFRTAYPVMITTLAQPAQLERANSRLLGAESVANSVGPGLAGMIAQFIGAALGVLSQVVGLVVSTVCLVGVGRTTSRSDGTGTDRAESEPAEDLKTRLTEGVRLTFRDPLLRSVMIFGGVMNFGQTGIYTIIVVFLANDLGLQPLGIGVVLAVGTVGGVAGALIAPVLSRRFGNGLVSRVMGAALIAIVLVPLATTATLAAIGLVLTAVAIVAGNVVRGAWRQAYVPKGMLGRVVSASQLINYGTMPAAALAAGFLGQAIGVRATMFVMVGFVALAIVLLWCSPFGRYRVLPSSPGQFAEDRGEEIHPLKQGPIRTERCQQCLDSTSRSQRIQFMRSTAGARSHRNVGSRVATPRRRRRRWLSRCN